MSDNNTNNTNNNEEHFTEIENVTFGSGISMTSDITLSDETTWYSSTSGDIYVTSSDNTGYSWVSSGDIVYDAFEDIKELRNKMEMFESILESIISKDPKIGNMIKEAKENYEVYKKLSESCNEEKDK
jgi:hypothetical protein